jgi:hypothetical protein
MKKLIVYLLVLAFSMSIVYAVPSSWYGYVTLNGSTASDGTVVDAYISSSIKGTTTVGAVQSSGYYLVHVDGNVGDSVSFKVYGNSVSQAAQTWSAGFHHPTFNLTASYTANGGACPTYSGYTSGTNVVNLGCAGGYCVHDICRAASTYCGDGYCDTGESCTSDCGGGGGDGGGGSTSTVTAAVCDETWKCTDWSDCTAVGTQIRSCVDKSNCNTTANKPTESQACTYTPPVQQQGGINLTVPTEPLPAAQPQPAQQAPAPAKPTIPLGAEIIVLIALVAIAVIVSIRVYKGKR